MAKLINFHQTRKAVYEKNMVLVFINIIPTQIIRAGHFDNIFGAETR